MVTYVRTLRITLGTLCAIFCCVLVILHSITHTTYWNTGTGSWALLVCMLMLLLMMLFVGSSDVRLVWVILL